MEYKFEPLDREAQPAEESRPIGVVADDRCAVIAAGGGVVDGSRRVFSGSAWHLESVRTAVLER